MDLQDITGAISIVEALFAKIKSLGPHAWKGNDEPNTHHWDAGSIVANCGLDLPTQRAWVSFKFTDGGKPHEIKSECPILHFGEQGGADTVTLDGVATLTPDFELSHRYGFEGFHLYNRVLCIFEFSTPQFGGEPAKHRFRFDGDI